MSLLYFLSERFRIYFPVTIITSYTCPQLKVLRDGRWIEVEAAVLVPGDIISIKLGDIVPADSRLLDGDPLKIDQVFTCRFFFYLGVQ